MSSGQSDSKATNKTEFMRYMNEHPQSCRILMIRAKEYDGLFIRGNKFGDWLRQRHLIDFANAYRIWWLKRRELYGKVYEQQNQLSVLAGK